jgi:hypothetical protein
MSLNKLFSFKLSLATAAVAAFLSVGTASARTVDLSAYGWAAATDNNVDLTILSAGSNGLVLRLQKFADFTEPKLDSNTFQPLSIVFRQLSSSAAPSIVIEEENVLNDTGETWGGFRFLLEGGVNGNTPKFDTSASSSFATNPFNDKVFKNNDKELLVTGGSLSSGNFPTNLWQPGRTDGALYINANPLSSGALKQTFVFKEQPILIPLPAAAWTSLSGLVAVGLLVGAKQARRILA